MFGRLLVAFALGASALAAPAGAHAATPDVVHGGCAFVSDSHVPRADGQEFGVLYNVTMTTTGDIPPTPIDATVSCWIVVNGVEAPGTRFSYSGPGVQVGADRASFDDGGDLYYPYTVCQSVAFADGTTSPINCGTPDVWRNPPEWNAVINDLNAVFGAIADAAENHIDPVVCQVLANSRAATAR
jgi:hypothetical protein